MGYALLTGRRRCRYRRIRGGGCRDLRSTGENFPAFGLKGVNLTVVRLGSRGPNKATLPVDPKLDRDFDRRSVGNHGLGIGRHKFRVISLEEPERCGASVLSCGYSVERYGVTTDERTRHC